MKKIDEKNLVKNDEEIKKEYREELKTSYGLKNIKYKK